MIIIDCIQGSELWLKIRTGIPCSSNFDRIITTKGESSTQRQKYLYQLAGERLTGMPMETYTNGNMERGKELEASARAAYEFITDNEVKQVGFCLNSEERNYGCSPDGLIGDDGGIEIKCPTLPVAVEYLDKGILPTAYFQQVQGCMLITGRAWWDFVSYHPSLPLLIMRTVRDVKFTDELRVQLHIFQQELTDLTKKISRRA